MCEKQPEAWCGWSKAVVWPMFAAVGRDWITKGLNGQRKEVIVILKCFSCPLGFSIPRKKGTWLLSFCLFIVCYHLGTERELCKYSTSRVSSASGLRSVWE